MAADVPLDVYLERLPTIGEMVQNIVVTVSDNDDVLRVASRFMGGSERIGSEEAGIREEEFVLANNINHSDIIFFLRTDLPAHQRGLEASELERVWYITHDYPERIRKVAEKELDGQW